MILLQIYIIQKPFECQARMDQFNHFSKYGCFVNGKIDLPIMERLAFFAYVCKLKPMQIGPQKYVVFNETLWEV